MPSQCIKDRWIVLTSYRAKGKKTIIKHGVKLPAGRYPERKGTPGHGGVETSRVYIPAVFKMYCGLSDDSVYNCIHAWRYI